MKNPTTPGKTMTPAEQEAAKKRAEEKRANFVKLATTRLDKALTAIGVLKNLANKNNYTFSDTDREVIVKKIDDACEVVDNAFKAALAGKAVAAEKTTSTYFS